MRILLDECVPRRLRSGFPGHDVRTVPKMGWSGIKNGVLLRLMTGERFDVLVTVDQNLRHQQNPQTAGVARIIFIAASNRAANLMPLLSSIESQMAAVQLGAVIEIHA